MGIVEPQQAPPRRPRPPLIWPWLLLLLLLVLAGLGAWWFLARDDNGNGSTSGPIVVPNVIGLPVAQALARVGRRGLVGRVETKSSGDVPPGAVFAEDPDAGSNVARRSVVTLSVASGRSGSATAVAVPNVVGQLAPAATARLRAKGFSVRVARAASDQAQGTVIAQRPRGGTVAPKGSPITIRVSRGTATVPSVVGKPLGVAVARLKAEGLEALILRVPSNQRKGTVVAQSPQAGARSTGGGLRVRVYVSVGKSAGAEPPPPLAPSTPAGNSKPATVTVPDVTGQAQENAQRRLNSTGLKAGVVFVPSEDSEGNVGSQFPSSGTRKRGTRIQLNVSLGPNPGQQVTIPAVLGSDPAAAKSKLRSAGFEVLTLPQGVSDRSQIRTVVDEQPARGRRAPSGSTVVVYVGRAA